VTFRISDEAGVADAVDFEFSETGMREIRTQRSSADEARRRTLSPVAPTFKPSQDVIGKG